MVSFFSSTVGSKEASLDTHSLEDCIQQKLGVWKEAKESGLLATGHDMFGNNAEVGAELEAPANKHLANTDLAHFEVCVQGE
jgi:hypothetical protein